MLIVHPGFSRSTNLESKLIDFFAFLSFSQIVSFESLQHFTIHTIGNFPSFLEDKLTFFYIFFLFFLQRRSLVQCCNVSCSDFFMYSSMYIVKEPDCKVHILNYTLLSFYTHLLELKLPTICGIYRLWESCLLG